MEKISKVSNMKDMRLNNIKFECHRLMDLIFGTKKKEKFQDYFWLKKHTGVEHFSLENDYGKVFMARKRLQEKAIENGILSIEEIDLI